jgi:hypothetical protein
MSVLQLQAGETVDTVLDALTRTVKKLVFRFSIKPIT